MRAEADKDALYVPKKTLKIASLSFAFFNLNDGMLVAQLRIKGNSTNWRAAKREGNFPPESFRKNDNMRRDLPEIIAAQS